MGKYVCLFYQLSGGKKPAKEFIESLNRKTRDLFVIKVKLIEEFGPSLRQPHTKNIGEGIFELRFKGQEGQIRVLFFFYYKRQIVFTNGFIKKTQKTPINEIRIAEARRKTFMDTRR